MAFNVHLPPKLTGEPVSTHCSPETWQWSGKWKAAIRYSHCRTHKVVLFKMYGLTWVFFSCSLLFEQTATNSIQPGGGTRAGETKLHQIPGKCCECTVRKQRARGDVHYYVVTVSNSATSWTTLAPLRLQRQPQEIETKCIIFRTIIFYFVILHILLKQPNKMQLCTNYVFYVLHIHSRLHWAWC